MSIFGSRAQQTISRHYQSAITATYNLARAKRSLTSLNLTIVNTIIASEFNLNSFYY